MKAAKDNRKIGDTYSWESAYEYQGVGDALNEEIAMLRVNFRSPKLRKFCPNR